MSRDRTSRDLPSRAPPMELKFPRTSRLKTVTSTTLSNRQIKMVNFTLSITVHSARTATLALELRMAKLG